MYVVIVDCRVAIFARTEELARKYYTELVDDYYIDPCSIKIIFVSGDNAERAADCIEDILFEGGHFDKITADDIARDLNVSIQFL